MNDPRKSFGDTIRDYARDLEARAIDHPDTQMLALYLDDLLSPEETRTLQNHIAVCRTCNEVLDILETPEPDDVALAVTPEVAEAVPMPPVKHKTVWRLLTGGGALAAAILLFFLWPQKPEQVAPWFGRLETAENRGGAGAVFAVPETASGLMLNVDVPAGEPFDTYEVGCTLPDGRVFSVRDLQLEAGPRLLCFLPRARLTTGAFQLHVVGIRDGAGSVPLKTYRFSVRLD